MMAPSADIAPVIVSEPLRNLRARPSPIREVAAEKYSIGLCISKDIVHISLTAHVAMMRILLMPIPGRILEIDIVSERLFLTSPQIGSFLAKSTVFPVLIERQCLCNTHGIHKQAISVSLAAASAHNPVPD